ncbi:MAG: ferritin family protein [Chloroflexota bacterium]
MTNNHALVLNILQQARQNEIDTHRFYLDAAEQVQDPRGQEMYRFLAEEELEHERIVHMQIDALTGGKGWVAPAGIRSGPLDDFQTLFGAAREKLRQYTRPDDKELDALIIALEMEDNSYKAYRQALEVTVDAVGELVLQHLARAEQTHFDLVMQNYESLLYRQHWQGLLNREGEDL